jgi:hypothetical protein
MLMQIMPMPVSHDAMLTLTPMPKC